MDWLSPTPTKAINKFLNDSNVLLSGLEDFENKIDKIASGVDQDEDSWLNQIYNKFSEHGDITEGLEEVDGLEPPMLDETWGLKDDSGKGSSMDEGFQKDLKG